MNFLAFDTSTEMMSIGVSRTVDGHAQQWLHTGVGGAQASTGLIAGVLALMAQAELSFGALDAICFGSGPGSFTGLRTACSVAQGLAFAANVPVLPVESLLAVAEEARHTHLTQMQTVEITALLDARMDELYTARYAFDGALWSTVLGSRLVRPEDLPTHAGASTPLFTQALAGNVFDIYGARLSPAMAQATPVLCLAALPTASAMLRLAPQLLAQGGGVPAAQALPVYIRDKVAKTTLERAAEKAAVSAVAPGMP
jgi:tRNA threonylcarbamoyladenosine biosynthesis protein TsaB